MDRNDTVQVVVVIVNAVALRKESVDRNFTSFVSFPSNTVALRKESVDRNCSNHFKGFFAGRRSPQGERG